MTHTKGVTYNYRCNYLHQKDQFNSLSLIYFYFYFQVNELDNILSQNKAVLQHDGKFTIQNSMETNITNGEHENVIQISDDDDNEETNSLKCRICEYTFIFPWSLHHA